MYCVRSLITFLRKSQKINVPVSKILNKPTVFQPIYYSTQLEEEDETDTIVKTICKGNAELEKRLKILMLEVEVMRQDGRYAPDNIKLDQWEHLLTLKSRNQRSSYLTYLFKTEKAKENEKAKREARRKEFDENPRETVKEYEDDLLYSIQHQSLFIRIRDQSINNYDNYRALQAITYGQSVVIDCSYEDNMVYRETVNAAKQMTFVFGDNRLHKNPFNLHLCNLNMGGPFLKQLRKNIPCLEEPWFPLNLHTNSYLDLFPKEKLVYLTPHCREELTQFDHDAIYIIGCMVDKINNEPLSLAKAKRDGIKMARLPLDRYLEWAPGSKKNLNINHMVPILLDLKSTGDWEVSLKHIPKRKLMETKIMAMQKKISRKPALKEEILKNFKMPQKLKQLTFEQKRSNSRRSLFKDDEKI